LSDQLIRVLLIDADRFSSGLISRILSENYNVALEVRQHLPKPWRLGKNAYDIILADPFQNDVDAEAFVSEIKTLYPRIPIVFITKNQDPPAIIEGFRMGITDYLIKPFLEDDFKRMFQRALFALYSRQSPALEGIFQICQQLNLCRSTYRFFYILAIYIAKTLSAKRVIVLLQKPESTFIEVLHTMGVPKTQEAPLQELINRERLELPSLHDMFTFVQADKIPAPIRKIVGGAGNYLYVSIGNAELGRGIIGVFLGERAKEPFMPLLPGIEELINESGIIYSNLMEFLKTREIALKDDLTGLYNMRSFKFLVENELFEADTKGYPVAALFLDIDNFKGVNDTFGHLVGSKLLKEIADILMHNLRRGELVFRFGGDEFVIILPATNLDPARQIGERIRSNIASHVFQSREGEEIRLTVSIGVAVYPGQTKNFRELLEAADRAMYHGKKTTKNVVYVTGDSLTTPD